MENTLLPHLDSHDLFDLRLFLVPRWVDWGIAHHKKVTNLGEGMCRFTSAFLQRVLGKPWRVEGGEADFYDFSNHTFKPRPSGGGFFDGTQWQSHYWVSDGKSILDFTASQFGAETFVITSVSDSRYKKIDFLRGQRDEVLRDVRDRAQVWAKEWKSMQVASDVLEPFETANSELFHTASRASLNPSD